MSGDKELRRIEWNARAIHILNCEYKRTMKPMLRRMADEEKKEEK
jgi:hypothetical protein